MIEVYAIRTSSAFPKPYLDLNSVEWNGKSFYRCCGGKKYSLIIVESLVRYKSGTVPVMLTRLSGNGIVS